jgi:EF hand
LLALSRAVGRVAAIVRRSTIALRAKRCELCDMKKQPRRLPALSMALATALALAAGCKTDNAPSASPPTTAPSVRSDDTAARPAPTPPAEARPPAPAPALPAQAAQGDGSPGADWRARRAAELDKDGDGKVSDAERAAALHDRADQMRRRLDANADGKLTPDELANARGRMRFDDPAALDTNHDGDISADELAAGLKARADQRRARRVGSDTPGTQP